MKHKNIQVFMILSLVFTLLFVSACSSNTSSGTNSKSTSAPSAKAPTVNEDGKPNLPLVSKPVTLTWFSPLDSKVSATKKSYAEVEIFPLLEKETGIKIEFDHPPSGMENEQFNLMLASGNLNDIIVWDWFKLPGGPEKALADGVIMPLNDLIDEHAPHFKAFLEKHPDVKREFVTDDGVIYMFPNAKVEPWQRASWGFQIRKDWLDKVGKNVPTTIDEWYEVLTAFKENNLGGDKTYPFSNQMTKPNFSILPLAHFLNAWGMTYGFYQENGEIRFGPAQPEYLEYLTMMKKWYDEGLIDPEFASNDEKQFNAKITGNQVGAYAGLLSGGMGKYMGLMKNNPEFELVGAPYPKAKDGKEYNFFNITIAAVGGLGAAVAGTSKKAVEAVKYLDVAYSEWGHNLYNFGIEGVSYNWVDGYPQFTDAVLNNPDQPPASAISQYTITGTNARFHEQDPRYYEQMLEFPTQRPAAEVWGNASPEKALPLGLTPTPQESRVLAPMINDLYTYTDEMFVKFITGRESLSNFDSYLKQINAMDLEQIATIYESAMERYNQR